MTSRNAAIAVATSIPPRLVRRNNGQEIGDAYQKLCIQSWIDCGFRVLSINPREEIADLSSRYPQVRFVATDRSQSAWTGRKHPYIADLLLALQQADEPVVGIINSDLVFEPSSIWGAALPSLVRESIVIGQRHDTGSLLNGALQQFQYGFDWFFFDRGLAAAVLPNAMPPYAMGLPWWDFWLPLAAAAQGRRILAAERPSVVHLAHEPAWVITAWRELAVPFSRYIIDVCETAPDAMPESLAAILPICRAIATAGENALRGDEYDNTVHTLARSCVSQIRKTVLPLEPGGIQAGNKATRAVLAAEQTQDTELTVAGIFRHFEQRRSAGEALMRGKMLLEERKWTEALPELLAAREELPEDFEILCSLAECAFMKGDVEKAYTVLLQAEQQQPRSVDVLNNIGVALEAMGRRQQAIECFEKILTLTTNNPRAWINLAAILHKANRLREALALLERARQQWPSSAPVEKLYRTIAQDLSVETLELSAHRGISF